MIIQKISPKKRKMRIVSHGMPASRPGILIIDKESIHRGSAPLWGAAEGCAYAFLVNYEYAGSGCGHSMADYAHLVSVWAYPLDYHCHSLFPLFGPFWQLVKFGTYGGRKSGARGRKVTPTGFRTKLPGRGLESFGAAGEQRVRG